MRLFITGATGLVGRRLVVDRLERGDQVILLSRDATRADGLFAASANRNITVVAGNPAAPGAWQTAIAGCDAVIHLAGAGVADRRWSARYKKILRDSRIDSTHQVVTAIGQASSSQRPQVLINASAVGYYGEGGEHELNENERPGPDFLARLCVDWERQAETAREHGARVVMLRTGVVLDARGGALPQMVKIFNMYVGGPLGRGLQFMPWIHWRDVLGLIDLSLEERELRGPINVVAPQTVRNREFAIALGDVLGRPSRLPTPRLALRLALGEVAKYVTMSQRVIPAKAREFGYSFLHPALKPALEALLEAQVENEAVDAMPRSNAGAAPAIRDAVPAAGMSGDARPSRPIRLLAIAVDGTLLRSDGVLPQGVIQACRSARRAGCAVVLATARPPRALRSVIQMLDLPDPAITHNGAVIWDPQRDQPLYHEPLSPQVARQVIECARAAQPQIMVGVERMDEWYTDRLDEGATPESIRLVSPAAIGPLDQFLEAPVTKVNLLGPPERIDAAVAAIREPYWRSRLVSVFRSEPWLLQIAHPMVDKGIALQRVANRLGIGRDEVMALGDGANDAGMIEWAGFGVAMANAVAAVKRLAKAAAPSNDELGAVHAIHRFVLTRR